MTANIDLIKTIRYQTNLSFKDIKNAIDTLQTDDIAKIISYLKEQGVLKSAAKQGREASEGSIFTYTHESRIGVMIKVNCETDFVSRGDDFKAMGTNLCLHLAAYQPKFIKAEEVSEEFIGNELEIAKQKLIEDGKDEAMIVKILEGKKSKIASEVSFLSQPFIMDSNISVGDYIGQTMAKTGENIQVAKFVIFNLND
jgi:elongation factor Ts